MRTLLFAGAAIATLAGSAVAVVHAADIYEPAPQYGAAPPAYQPPPPPGYGPPPAAVYAPPPRYGYAPPVYGPHPGYAPPPPQQQAYGPPPVVAYEDDEEVVAPPRLYRDAPVYLERPVYQHCWWDWGRRVCAPRRGW
jgi:hypothetical protein